MRVLVTGGRDFSDRELAWRVLNELHASTPVTELAQGGARGADSIARDWAVSAEVLKVVTYPAWWRKERGTAGPRRNRRMLEDFRPDVVVAFPGNRGTADTIRAAREMGHRVIEIRPHYGKYLTEGTYT